MSQIPWLSAENNNFPPTSTALSEPNGLLAVGGDLNPSRLINAYHLGIFPWFDELQPLLWWSPDPRSVIIPENIHISRSLRKTIRSGRFKVTADTCFNRVIELCSKTRNEVVGTWITDEMKAAYNALHSMGYAHSIETWNNDQQLVGGLYGLALGRVFFGESMFSLESDASKTAFVALTSNLRRQGYVLIDCQIESGHMNSLGATNISRERFESMLRDNTNRPSTKSNWQTEFNWTSEQS
jgi:leucyl/phenylalanyl-tRNA---protein transferase